MSRALKLLDLPEPIREAIDAGRIAPSIACEIGKIDDAERQSALAKQVLQQRLNRAQTREVSRNPGRGLSEPTTRRSFETVSGRLTVSLSPAGDRSALIDALLEAIDILEQESDDE